jgi:ankyrin repeat protein
MSSARNGIEHMMWTLLHLQPDYDLDDGDFGPSFFPPLHAASGGGSAGMVQLLLQKGADPNSRSGSGKTALMTSCAERKAEVAALLLKDPRIRVRLQDEQGRTALHYVKATGPGGAASLASAMATVVVPALLKLDPTLLETIDYSGNTPLLQACHNGEYEVTASLLAAGANANVVNWKGMTPLFWAASNGHANLVTLLLEKGEADPNFQNLFPGLSALMLAATNGHLTTAQALLKAGAMVGMATRTQSTAMHFAVKNGHSAIVQLLLTAKANVNAQDETDAAPLHLAAAAGDAPTIAVLLANKASLNLKDQQQCTPLNYAAGGRHPYCAAANAEGECKCFVNCVKLLKDAGAKLFQPSSIATHFNNTDSIRFTPPQHQTSGGGSSAAAGDALPRIFAVTMDELIRRLTYKHYSDVRSTRTFLMCYHRYLTPRQLLDRLRARYGLSQRRIPRAPNPIALCSALLLPALLLLVG